MRQNVPPDPRLPNLLTGQPAVADIDRPKKHPDTVGPTEADPYVIWKSAPLGLSTREDGAIGPVPYRRAGGHTGSRGTLEIAGHGIALGAAGASSSSDVVPTLIDLLGEGMPVGLSGTSAAAKVKNLSLDESSVARSEAADPLAARDG